RGLTSDASPNSPRSTYWLLVEKIPLLLLSIACGALAWYTQQQAGAVNSLVDVPLSGRAANAVLSYFGYLYMTALPLGLAPLYPLDPENLPAWKVVGAAVFLAAVSALSVWQARRRPALFVGWWWYVGTLVPVIGLVQVGSQALADR